jgi:hypothetical protein
VTVTSVVKKKRLVPDSADDEVAASQRVPVITQYKLLFRDGCYIFMFLAGSQIFGLLGAVGGSLVQEVVIWGGSEVGYDDSRTSVLPWLLFALS